MKPMSTQTPPSISDNPTSLIGPEARAVHLSWLFELTSTPSAAGKESRVIAWIHRWIRQRTDLSLSRDSVGNLTICFIDEPPIPLDAPAHDRVPLYITAHLDHPAFVIEEALGEGKFEASFRGGVMDEYFPNAPVAIYPATSTNPISSPNATSSTTSNTAPVPAPIRARVERKVEGTQGPFNHWILTAEPNQPWRDLAIGDVGVWDVGPPQLIEGNVHTLACDDLAAAAAALAAFDVLRELDQAARREGRRAFARPVRLFFTRAEEVGFIGTIAAVRENSVPKDARVLLLENSRSFPDSPIGAGPIVRVGDRISIFSPRLTDAIAKRAEELAGGPSIPRATDKAISRAWKWQRKLMVGGACEASVFCAAGYQATCVCLALGNYHNMTNLTEVQAGTYQGIPPIAREYISLSDFEGLVDLLVACGVRLGPGGFGTERFDKLWKEAAHVLD